MASIRVLVAAPHDGETRKLAHFFMTRNCITDVEDDARRAERLAGDALGGGRAYHLVIADERLPGADGLDLLGRIRAGSPDSRCVLLTGADHHDTLRTTAAPLGIRHVLPKPVDFSQIQEILDRVDASLGGTGTGRGGSGDESPFFGTRRIGTGRIGTSSGSGRLPASAPGTGRTPLPPDPFEAQVLHHGRHQAPQPSTTERLRASPSSRIRRGVTGRITHDQQERQTRAQSARLTRAAKRMRCGHCGEIFSVIRKDEPYTMPCIHCGGRNSIAP